MYTVDDRKKKYRIGQSSSKNYTKKTSRSVEVNDNFYGDYYDDYEDNSNKIDTMINATPNKNINNIDTTYTDDYSDGTLNKMSPWDMFKKKYVVLITILGITLLVLVIFLVKTINVKTPPKGENGNYVRLFYEELEMKVGDRQKLEVTLSDPKNNYKIEWFSNNDSVVEVDSTGNIVAVSEGEAIIMVAYYVDDKVYDAQCIVHVLK